MPLESRGVNLLTGFFWSSLQFDFVTVLLFGAELVQLHGHEPSLRQMELIHVEPQPLVAKACACLHNRHFSCPCLDLFSAPGSASSTIVFFCSTGRMRTVASLTPTNVCEHFTMGSPATTNYLTHCLLMTLRTADPSSKVSFMTMQIVLLTPGALRYVLWP
jgi:hypothetical protein